MQARHPLSAAVHAAAEHLCFRKMGCVHGWPADAQWRALRVPAGNVEVPHKVSYAVAHEGQPNR